MKYRAVLLDMGGVLIDFGGGRGLPVGKADWRGREALLHYLQQRGAKLDLEELDALLFAPWFSEYRQRQERGREAAWNSHLRRLRRRVGLRTHAVKLLGLWFRPMAEQLEPLVGVREALALLRQQGYVLSLISNVPLPGRLYREVLERHGLADAFSSMHFSYDEKSRKPSPAMLRLALAALQVPASRAIMVGDRRAVDIVAGRSAGTATAWVRSDDGGGPQADLVIDSLAELPGALRGLG
ncbi:MAG: HAD family hydrolase [Acidobacteriota bacterium]|nr:HAD family hydrolase [Acidobacteriota bacterium]